MKIKVDLPDDPDLRAFVAAILAENESLKQRVLELEKMCFGPRSEKLKPFDTTQPGLLPFPEFLALAQEAEEAKRSAEQGTIEVPAHQRKKPARRSEFPDHLPRFRKEYELDPHQRTCCGQDVRVFSHDVSREIERIEINFVVEHAVEKGVCDRCGRIVVAQGPQRVFAKSLLGPNFLARVIYERFGNHMPYARLERKYADEGLNLSRSVLCSSVLRCAEILHPVYDAHRTQVLGAALIQADDTEVVQRNGNRKGRKKVHLWAYRADTKGVFYEVTPSRSRDGPRATLAGTSGYLQCDGHSCFQDVGKNLIRVGCWSHLRRKFVTALDGGDELARGPFDLIERVFAIERLAKQRCKDLENGWDDGLVLALRQERTRSIVEDLKAWADHQQLDPERAPKSPLMKAVTYLVNQWPTLTKFLQDGSIHDITNNACERALRGPVLGRRNWLFFGDEEGARLGPILMSLVQSCKELGVNPLLYLADVLLAVSTTSPSRIKDLTPAGWNRIHGHEPIRPSRPTLDAAMAHVLASS